LPRSPAAGRAGRRRRPRRWTAARPPGHGAAYATTAPRRRHPFRRFAVM